MKKTSLGALLTAAKKSKPLETKEVKIRPKRKPKEASIEQRVVFVAVRELNMMTRKLNGAGARDWPDRLFAPDHAPVVFMELKRQGEEPTEKQYQKLQELRDRGHVAVWFDNAAGAIAFLRGHVRKYGKKPKR